MRTPLSLSYGLIFSLLVTSCGGSLGDYAKLTRRGAGASSGSGGTTYGATSIDAKQQASEKLRLIDEGKKSFERIIKLKTQLEDLQQKVEQPDDSLKKPEELVNSLSLIVGDIEKDAASLKDVGEAFKAVAAGKAPGEPVGLGLTDAAPSTEPVTAQSLLRRVSRLTTASDAYFLQGKEDCKDDPTPYMDRFSAASFYQTNFEHCRAVNRMSPEQLAASGSLGLRDLSVLEIIAIVIRSLITLLMRIATAEFLGFLFGEDGSLLVLNPLLGQVMHHNKTKAIFWGTSWKEDTSDVIPGIDHFLRAWGDSGPAALLGEYYDIHGPITAKSEYLGYEIDDTPTPRPDWGPILFTIMGEVCKLTKNNPDPEVIYMVYTDAGLGDFKFPAMHYPGLCGRKPFQVTWMPKVDVSGVRADKDAAGHSSLLSSLAMASAHELWETMANPMGDGWYTLKDYGEVGDRCYTTFAPTPGQLSTLSDGSKWRLHTVWSNAAFKAKRGVGEKKGCIYAK
ncbi:MAG: hypothetical protein FJ146_15065 [Deltaproteobacteria bacterium]|nr:hypothetical protein [Deltaproteobacteria bacterium]